MTGDERAHKARLMVAVLRTMVGLGCFGLILSSIDPRNKLWVNVAFYAPIFVVIYGMWRMVSRGHVIAAAWVASLFFWILIAVATLFFGGVEGGNATAFGACVMLVGGVVGGRAAIAMAIGSSLWCGFVAILELEDALPRQFGPSTPLNAWIAITITLILMSVLLHASLNAMHAVTRQALATAEERDEALRRSIQAQKMEVVGNLASGVAHDFNNLLTVISSVSALLRESVASGSPIELELLDDLDAAAERAVLMNRQLLSFGQVRAATVTSVDLAELVDRLGTMLPRLLGSKIVVALDVARDAMVAASAAGVEQVLLNLAVNARDAMLPAGGRLTIRVVEDGDHVKLVVEDGGVGMSAELQDKIFAPFFTTKPTGTGLGLATVRSVVEQFGGTVGVTSEPGRGTTFEIRFKRAVRTAPPRPSARSLPTTTVSPAGRILLADDDPLVRRTIVRVLEQVGFEVVAVTNGAEALAVLERVADFACVVSDVSMPVLDGDVLAARIAALYPRLPMLLMSGNREPASLASHHCFVAKPVERAALLAAIEQLISRGRAADRIPSP